MHLLSYGMSKIRLWRDGVLGYSITPIVSEANQVRFTSVPQKRSAFKSESPSHGHNNERLVILLGFYCSSHLRVVKGPYNTGTQT